MTKKEKGGSKGAAWGLRVTAGGFLSGTTMEYAGISRPHGKNEINAVKRRCRSHIQSHECSSKWSMAHTEECRGGKKRTWGTGGWDNNETKVWEREFRGATKGQWTSEPTLKFRGRRRESTWMRLLWWRGQPCANAPSRRKENRLFVCVHIRVCLHLIEPLCRSVSSGFTLWMKQRLPVSRPPQRLWKCTASLAVLKKMVKITYLQGNLWMCDNAVSKLVFWVLLSSLFTCHTVRIKRTEDGWNGGDRQGNWEGGGVGEWGGGWRGWELRDKSQFDQSISVTSRASLANVLVGKCCRCTLKRSNTYKSEIMERPVRRSWGWHIHFSIYHSCLIMWFSK